jgi:hypothetical protein
MKAEPERRNSVDVESQTETQKPESDNGQDVSRLEQAMATAKLPRRPISRNANEVDRHAQRSDLNVNELDFSYDLEVDQYPLSSLDSPQGLLSAVLYHEHVTKTNNFAAETSIECLRIDEREQYAGKLGS